MATTRIAKIPYDRLLYIGIYDNSKKRYPLSNVYAELLQKYPGKEVSVMNAGFFNGDFTSALALKSGGIPIDTRWSAEAFYCFNADSKPELFPAGYANCPLHKKDAVAVHPPLLENGKKHPGFRYAVDNSDRGRSLIGHNEKEFVMVCVQDTSGDSDLTLDECIKLMQEQGCTYAGNLDGGGSSQCNFAGRTVSSSRIVHNFIYVIAEPSAPDTGNKDKEKPVSENTSQNGGYPVDGQITKNFSVMEATNKMASDPVKLVLSPELIEHAQMLQQLRDWYGKPLEVSSWYRTKAFNASVNGDANSEHLQGVGTDINNIPASLYHDFEVAWKVICTIHGKIGNIGFYSWGMHFGSDAGRYGVTTHYVKDWR